MVPLETTGCAEFHRPAARRTERALTARLWGGAVFVACAGVLTIARSLTPSPTGMGTHMALGAPPCSVPTMWGVPCPTCGMTTAFAHAVRGQWLSAFQAQPTGFLAAIGCALAAIWGLSAAMSGRSGLQPALWRWDRIVFVSLGLILFGWAYKLLTTLWQGTTP